MYFQLTASRGGRHNLPNNIYLRIDLSTHGLTRRPTELTLSEGVNVILSTHGLTRRPTMTEFVNKNTIQLSTHGLTRRPTLRQVYPHVQAGFLSTHGLTRRPTDRPVYFFIIINLSTHGLTRRPTAGVAKPGAGHSFQLTASRGGRLIQDDTIVNRNHLSTHGLTRRPTEQVLIFLLAYFLSTHGLTRRPTPSAKKHSPPNTFQLTASRGGRHFLLGFA